MAAVYELHICTSCHNRLQEKDIMVPWEGRLYCEYCFDSYVDSIEPSSWVVFKENQGGELNEES